jgi:predicted TIM-barrel fold metal-dependent hydrolase
MRILDADCHISPTPESGNSIGYEELLRRMDKAGVEKALTWLQPPYLRSNIELSNRYIHEAAIKHPDRILGFGWADPNLGIDHAIREAERCIHEYCFYGVKLNGAQNGFPIDDPERSFPIVETLARAHSRLAFHIGADSYNNTHPYRLAKVADRFPTLTIFAVHMGGASFDDMSDLVIDVAKTRPNIYLVGSAVRAIPILKAIRTLGADRVCFGSDTPFELLHVEVAKYESLLKDEISASDYAKVMGGNLARIFGLEAV